MTNMKTSFEMDIENMRIDIKHPDGAHHSFAVKSGAWGLLRNRFNDLVHKIMWEDGMAISVDQGVQKKGFFAAAQYAQEVTQYDCGVIIYKDPEGRWRLTSDVRCDPEKDLIMPTPCKPTFVHAEATLVEAIQARGYAVVSAGGEMFVRRHPRYGWEHTTTDKMLDELHDFYPSWNKGPETSQCGPLHLQYKNDFSCLTIAWAAALGWEVEPHEVDDGWWRYRHADSTSGHWYNADLAHMVHQIATESNNG